VTQVAFAVLVNARIVDIYDATPEARNGVYWVELERLEPRTAGTP